MLAKINILVLGAVKVGSFEVLSITSGSSLLHGVVKRR